MGCCSSPRATVGGVALLHLVSALGCLGLCSYLLTLNGPSLHHVVNESWSLLTTLHLPVMVDAKGNVIRQYGSSPESGWVGATETSLAVSGRSAAGGAVDVEDIRQPTEEAYTSLNSLVVSAYTDYDNDNTTMDDLNFIAVSSVEDKTTENSPVVNDRQYIDVELGEKIINTTEHVHNVADIDLEVTTIYLEETNNNVDMTEETIITSQQDHNESEPLLVSESSVLAHIISVSQPSESDVPLVIEERIATGPVIAGYRKNDSIVSLNTVSSVTDTTVTVSNSNTDADDADVGTTSADHSLLYVDIPSHTITQIDGDEEEEIHENVTRTITGSALVAQTDDENVTRTITGSALVAQTDNENVTRTITGSTLVPQTDDENVTRTVTRSSLVASMFETVLHEDEVVTTPASLEESSQNLIVSESSVSNSQEEKTDSATVIDMCNYMGLCGTEEPIEVSTTTDEAAAAATSASTTTEVTVGTSATETSDGPTELPSVPPPSLISLVGSGGIVSTLTSSIATTVYDTMTTEQSSVDARVVEDETTPSVTEEGERRAVDVTKPVIDVMGDTITATIQGFTANLITSTIASAISTNNDSSIDATVNLEPSNGGVVSTLEMEPDDVTEMPEMLPFPLSLFGDTERYSLLTQSNMSVSAPNATLLNSTVEEITLPPVVTTTAFITTIITDTMTPEAKAMDPELLALYNELELSLIVLAVLVYCVYCSITAALLLMAAILKFHALMVPWLVLQWVSVLASVAGVGLLTWRLLLAGVLLWCWWLVVLAVAGVVVLILCLVLVTEAYQSFAQYEPDDNPDEYEMTYMVSTDISGFLPIKEVLI